MSLDRVLITGGASGLGAAVATAVAKSGGQAFVLDRQAPDDGVDHAIVDLADSAATDAAVRAAAERLGGFDGVVCCAGIDSCGRLEDVPAADWERVIQVNLVGTATVARAALDGLRQRHGRLVTIASTLGLRALPDASAYCASKFGVVGLTRALATELAGDVGVTLVIPGGMQTSFFDGRLEQYRPPEDAQLNPPEQVARAIAFALETPAGTEIRELVVTPSQEPSWP
ncbi:SDR family NAD(P)-dependent oxidoreductase [Epidermidibacterium keratini]|uniref:SDR family NAD(P)-dependent oxidoreductase n=1 Tax=Epidermidibacterium keratini TaxID=1891644 RepID=A0A7L4YPA8_9ACTN|nr:SDR family oxidoreductase [Epidermidibacterium keratini]QHC00397.1 SDR family NAD(P)-dependent oxidoreductase [Epidermidibacterium keratini]